MVQSGQARDLMRKDMWKDREQKEPTIAVDLTDLNETEGQMMSIGEYQL